jgi:hypothetical protein
MTAKARGSSGAYSRASENFKRGVARRIVIAGDQSRRKHRARRRAPLEAAFLRSGRRKRLQGFRRYMYKEIMTICLACLTAVTV